jgi:hypothetical protein
MRAAQAIVHPHDADVSDDDHDGHAADDDDHQDDADDDRADGDHADDADDDNYPDHADDGGSYGDHADDDHVAGDHAAGSGRTGGDDVATAAAGACRGSAVDDVDAYGGDDAGDHAGSVRGQGRTGAWPKRSRAHAPHGDAGRCCAVRRLS